MPLNLSQLLFFVPGRSPKRNAKTFFGPPVICFHLVLFFWRGKHGCEPPRALPLCIGRLLTMIANLTHMILLQFDWWRARLVQSPHDAAYPVPYPGSYPSDW
jgi:hypothetical protein